MTTMFDDGDTDGDGRGGWHLDKKVPISIIFAVVAQTVTIIWWASGVEHRIQSSESRYVEMSATVKALEADRGISLQRISKTEQSLSDIREFLARMDAKLDRLSERR